MLLQEIMTDYLNENTSFEVENNFKPLNVKKSMWEDKDEKLKRAFTFEETRQLEAFIIEIIKFNRETNAIIETRFKEDTVGIIIHPVSGQISEIELEASKDINKIRKDVVYYYAKDWRLF